MERRRRLYLEYVDTFKVGGVLPQMMELKRVHTAMVVDNARKICAAEKFDAHTAEICTLAALLHDTGRYEQLKRYHTFRDSDSVDHAVFSHDIVREKGWLDDMAAADREAVLKAVLYHNRRELPEGLPPMVDTAAKCVRDADKLDIFRVLENQIATTDWRHDSTAFWNLRYDLPPNPDVIDAIKDGRPVDYQHIQSLADFVLIQVGWMKCGLYFASSRRFAMERGHYDYRRKFILGLVGYDIDGLGVVQTGGGILENQRQQPQQGRKE